MTVQTAYERYTGKAYAGQLADGFNPKYVKSLIAEGAVIYGRTVSQGTADDQAVQAGTPPIGIAIRDLNNENNIGSVSVDYADEQVMAVFEEGYIYIALANTGAKGAAIFSTDATGIISVGTAGAGETQLTGSFLDETMAAAGVARIFLKRL